MKYDIVYMVKNTTDNEELIYSLRSVERNFPHNKVWFAGGCPIGIKPDERLNFIQVGENKWQKVGNMIARVCKCEEITADFWLFNDDFFVMNPVEDVPPYYHGTLEELIERVERNSGGASPYTDRLRDTIKLLEERGLETKNYEEHIPMLFNRKKLLDMYKAGIRGAGRSLYGNLYKIGGVERQDVKIFSKDKKPASNADFLSTTDVSFSSGKVGEVIRSTFTEKSRFEK